MSHHSSVSIWSGQVHLHWRLPCSVQTNKQHCWLISPEINLSRQIFRHFSPTTFQAVSSKVRFQALGSVCCCLKCFFDLSYFKKTCFKMSRAMCFQKVPGLVAWKLFWFCRTTRWKPLLMDGSSVNLHIHSCRSTYSNITNRRKAQYRPIFVHQRRLLLFISSFVRCVSF